MNSPTGQGPEQLLAAALRAQASGGATPDQPPGPPLGPPPPQANPVAPRRRLPVLRVLLFALVLGGLAGGLIGMLSLV